MMQIDRPLLIRYSWLACCMLLLLSAFGPGYVQESKPEFALPQTDVQWATFLSANSLLSKAKADTTEATMPIVEDESAALVSSDQWNAVTMHKTNIITSKVLENADNLSKLVTLINSTEVPNNNTSNIDTESQFLNESRFVRWIDPKEKAVSAFIPEGW